MERKDRIHNGFEPASDPIRPEMGEGLAAAMSAHDLGKANPLFQRWIDPDGGAGRVRTAGADLR